MTKDEEVQKELRKKLELELPQSIVSAYAFLGRPNILNLESGAKLTITIYQIENNLIGGFYRSHSSKGQRDNLNARGMEFKKMCPHLSKFGDCGVHHDVNIFDIYRIVARIAGIAAQREIVQLEATKK